MKPVPLMCCGAIIVVLTGGLLLGAGDRETPAGAATLAQKGAAVWRLVSDYKLDGRLEPRETNRLVLTTEGQRLSGHFVDNRASGKENASTFSGEVLGIPLLHRGGAAERRLLGSGSATAAVIGGGRLLTLRQDDGAYTVIYAGRENDHDHFHGTWYDVSGNSGDFELSTETSGPENAPDPHP